MTSATELQLKQFIVENWVIMPEFDRKSPTSIESLLRSVSGLQYCKIVPSMSWPLDLNILLGKHDTMDILILSLGKRYLDAHMLTKIRALCLRITYLGFRH
jgi:hypothetical protein